MTEDVDKTEDVDNASILGLLSRLSFEGDVAEQEHGLSNIFLQTAAYWAVVHDEVDLVLGPKGSGKSAIARYLCDPQVDIPELNNTDIIPAFNLTGSLLFRRLASLRIEDDEDSDEIQREIFATYIVALAGNHVVLTYGDVSDNVDEIRKLLQAANLLVPALVTKTVFRKVLARLRPSIKAGIKLNDLGQPELTGSASFDGEPSDVDEAPAEVSLDYLEDLLHLLDKHYRAVGRRCWVLFDRLDEAFPDNRDLEVAALRGLLRAHLDLISDNTAIKSKLFLRSDILRRITKKKGFTNLSHIRTLRINWDSESLLHVMALRICAADILQVWTHGRIDSEHNIRQICRAILPQNVGRTDPLVWLLLVTPDSSRALNPRNLLTLLRAARYYSIELATRSERFAARRGLLNARSLMAGYEQLSLARMEDTVLADRFDLRDKIEKLRGKKIRFTKVDLSMRFQASGEELDAIVEDLREVGLLRLLEDDLIIPPLYRPALTIGVQGRELEINLDDANADVTTAVEQLADDDWATESSGSMTSDAKVHRARKRKNKRERYRDTTVDQIQISETDEEDDVHDKLERELTSDITPAPRKSERLEVEMSYAQSLANNGDVRAAFDHIFPQYAHSSHALLLACNFAVRIDDGALVDAVVAEATKPHWRNLSALMGRIFGLALLESDWEVASEVCAYLKGRQIDRAIFGLISMLDGLQEREWEVYSKWALLAGNSDPAPRSRSMEAVASVIAASRVLALARDSNESTHSSSIARWLNRYWVDFSGRNVSRTLHNFLGEYVRLKDTNFPSLFPYQILSIAEVLNHTRSLPQSLGDDVVLALVDVARSMSATDFDAFAAWRPYSTLADQVTIQIEIIRDAPPSR